MKILNELVDLANKANAAGQGTPEMVEFRVVSNPDNTLAIAEAFRALEQEVQKNLDGALAWQQRAEAAEAKLAELERQEPAAFTSEHYWSELNTFGAVKSVLLKNGNDPDFQVELFTRPAPAINLAELVPQPFDVFKQAGGVMVAVREGKTKNHLFGKGYNACIAYVINSIINSGELTRPDCESDEARLCKILRNIEEVK